MDDTVFIIVVVAYVATLLLVPLGFVVYSLRLVYLDGYHRLIFTDEDAQITSRLIRLKPDQETVTLPHGTYSLDNDAVRYMGRFRIPTYEYVKGISEPLIVSEDGLDFSQVTRSKDFERVAHNVAMTQLLTAMRKGIVNPVSMMAIGFVILAIITIAVGGYQISELQSIAEVTGAR